MFSVFGSEGLVKKCKKVVLTSPNMAHLGAFRQFRRLRDLRFSCCSNEGFVPNSRERPEVQLQHTWGLTKVSLLTECWRIRTDPPPMSTCDHMCPYKCKCTQVFGAIISLQYPQEPYQVQTHHKTYFHENCSQKISGSLGHKGMVAAING